MIITTTRKIIKIGDSAGVIIPASDLKQAGVKPGDEINITVEAVKSDKESVLAEYEAFKTEYGESLKNLADR